MRLDDVPDQIGWDAFYCVVTNADERSALRRAISPEYAAYSGPLMTSKILTDIYDIIAAFIYCYATANTPKGRRPKKPERYPAPWVQKDADKKTQTFGKGEGIPKSEFLDWYYNNQKEDENTDDDAAV